MSDPTNRPAAPDGLRARLRAGDPLGHEGAPAEEARALDRVAARLAAGLASNTAALDADPAAAWPRWLAPLAATAALVAAVWLGVRWVEAPARDAVAPPRHAQRANGAAPSAGGAAEPEIRQVQFQTTGGTRVVWVLDPRFAL